MADRLTPEELDAITQRHEADDEWETWSAAGHKKSHADRAALLRHVEALEREVERLKALVRNYKESWDGAKLDADGLKEEVERLREAYNVQAKMPSNKRCAEAAERKLARVTVCPEDENGRHRWDDTGQCWRCEQRAHMLIYEATGEGK